MANLEHPPKANPRPNPPPRAGEGSEGAQALRVAAIVLRTLFIVLLLLLTLRVSLPQSETIWTAYDTPADLVRLILGIGVCTWLVYQLFLVPRHLVLPRPRRGPVCPDCSIRRVVKSLTARSTSRSLL